MAFSISGDLAAGAQEQLDAVLDRRLKEQIRQAQEAQHAEQIAMQRKQIELQQRRDQAMDQERALDRQWRTEQGNIATADRTLKRTAPGQISDATAKNILLDPANAGMVSQRKVIDARPVGMPSVLPGSVAPGGGEATPALTGPALSAPLDTSGPQQFNVLEPTPEQAKTQFRQSRQGPAIEAIVKAQGEDARRLAYAQAIKEGLEPNDIPRDLVGATEAEKRQTALQMQIDAEKRANTENDRRNARDEANIRSRPKIMTPGQAINTARGLRKEFSKEVESATKLQNTYNIMQQGMEGVRKGFTNAGAQAVLITFQKMLDEDSVVREAEYARSGEGLALKSRLQGMIDTYVVGGAGVPPDELEKFVKMSEQFLNVAKRSAQKKAALYENFANEQGLDADFVTGAMNFDDDKDATTTGKGGGGGYDAYLNRKKP